MTTPLNIVFAGTPDFAAQHLQALIDSEHHVIAAYCPPDKPAGRGKKLTACATKVLAQSHDIPVYQPNNFKEVQDQLDLKALNADVMVVVAYGLLLPKVILDAPRLGCINVHGSLLPKWRGAAPIQRSLEAGDTETGVTIMQMDEGLDTGDMILKASCPILPTDTSASLYEKLAALGPQALVDTLALMAAGDYPREEQDNEQATYAAKLDKAQAEINWQQSARDIDLKRRAYFPWPGCHINLVDQEGKSHTVKVHQASEIEQDVSALSAGEIISADKTGIVVATSENAYRLEVLQLPGKKPLPVQDVLNGRAEWFVAGQSITGSGQGN
ncbi:methionyl-tRNA formyltransferase [Thalassotalea euphylliae]|uniref:Methionyl-tRNA formyltransferase n=1 Tax=Thalassotalea euphylliae TaxID=1655234 RepID=A0A3E0TKM1_9GAMM|nr:methionyl-tRNA formyltransferase [Thalassotalea euphylliae]REL25104.1 methionyl-tRNA formyltransferase [Thalassotalea euphylliae]